MGYLPFFGLAALLIASALGVVLSRNPIRSALSLVSTLFVLAVLFILLNAHLVAALQIVVYAGAIMVLFLFVIMLLNVQVDPEDSGVTARRLAAWGAGSLVALVIIQAAALTGTSNPGPGMDVPAPEGFGTTVVLGERLFTHFLLPFEITSLLLLVAMVGAVVVAKRKLD